MRIGLIWHNFESDNLGVGALSVGNLALVKRAIKDKSHVSFCTIGAKSERTKSFLSEISTDAEVEIEHRVINLKSMFLTILGVKSAQNIFYDLDCVIDISEGDSFTDIYGFKRMLKMSVTKLLATRYCPLVIAPQTLGPFRSLLSRFLASRVLSGAETVFVRDSASCDLADSMNIAATYVPDVAFAMPFHRRRTNGEKSLGLNVSGLLLNGGYNKNNQFGLAVNYRAVVKKIINEYQQRGYEVHLVPHVISDTYAVEDDYRASVELARSFSNVCVAPKFTNPIEAKSYISGFNVFIGSRMHATIAAFSAGVPVLCLAYSRKFEGVFGSLGYGQVVNLYEASEDDILNANEKFLDELPKIPQQLSEAAIEISRSHELYVNRLMEIFDGIS